MHPNETLIHRFYKAFGQKDYQTMQQAYDDKATFTDPVFQDLSAAEVKAMWKMLVASAKDLEISFDGVQADDLRGQCNWEARYTFSGTGRKVHNLITANFRFTDARSPGTRINLISGVGLAWRWVRREYF